MSDTAAGILFIVVLVAALALAYVPLGDYIYRVVTPTRHSRAERVIYRVIGVNPRASGRGVSTPVACWRSP
jgi:K+-transporting ATPase ATPase A chain